MSEAIRTTPWFSGDEKPPADRPGVYERDCSEVSWYSEDFRWCWWDGENFGHPALQPDSAAITYTGYGISAHQNLPWRGVLKDE